MKIIKINNEYFEEKTREKVEIVEELKTETIKILNRWDNTVIYESSKTTIREAVEEAISKEINLESANFKSANLKSANFKYANLKSANLEFANLEFANLKFANLESANLESANLESANLESANLKSANLKSAKTRLCTVNFSLEEYEVAKVFVEGLKND